MLELKFPNNQEKVGNILKLRKSGKTILKIKEITSLPLSLVKKVLIVEGKENLKPSPRLSSSLLTKGEILAQFGEWYYRFVNELSTNSTAKFEHLRGKAIKILFQILDELPKSPSYKHLNRILPVFIFSFLRANTIDVSISLLQNLSGMDRHKCFQALKRINGTFPEYIKRDRKQVVLGKVRMIKVFYGLDSRFFENATKILQRFWEFLCNTGDNIIAGTIAALALLSVHSNLPVLRVCEKIGISQSAIIYQLRNKLLKRLNITGFKTFRQAKKVLTSEVLEKVVGIKS
ncbi:hypothetical protein LCGC14_1531940 [marine sediment metagenome]|uniref:Uncharacterized protein n=1 Tax=marine sediment metagenome TaxID=412755 RepID=A0A0F9LBH6_9ZZZZ